VCHGEDPDEWAAAIAAVLSQPQRSRFSQSARQYALTRTWEHAMQPLYRAYREVHEGVGLAESSDTVTAAAHRA
jgi:hypothetical protein